VELILVRHGEPAWVSPDGRNRNDPELTALGMAQAALVARRLADSEDRPGRGDVDRLFVSPAQRARQTADPIARGLSLQPEIHDWLVELKSPETWDGAPIEVVRAAFAELAPRPREQWWEGHEGGESLREFHQRVTTGLRSLLAELGIDPADDPDARGLWDVGGVAGSGEVDRIVAVAHGGTNSAIIAHLLGAAPEPWEWDRFAMGHASVAVLATTPMAGHHIWSLRALGDANHLPLDDRTA
jgi:broad specificity phosphatase PhoE